MWRGRMRNSVPLLCLWSVHCCFAAGSPTPPGPEGRLQGNVHLPLLPAPHPSFSGPCPLSVSPTLLQPLPVPAKSSFLSHCPFALPQSALQFTCFLALRACTSPAKHPRSRRRVCALARAHPLAPPPSLIRFPGSVLSSQPSRLPAAL